MGVVGVESKVEFISIVYNDRDCDTAVGSISISRDC